eukprot:TRINITY_DN5586_c0_g1_i1.p2 TRINITY_DN5586_c0_g1~~TRINITY_DN5586_c0_g1_i1.p2  ORF type:complete len:197 (-),score=34.35 TRINITY_DN5586_c0_g1_i1:71-661(-)
MVGKDIGGKGSNGGKNYGQTWGFFCGARLASSKCQSCPLTKTLSLLFIICVRPDVTVSTMKMTMMMFPILLLLLCSGCMIVHAQPDCPNFTTCDTCTAASGCLWCDGGIIPIAQRCTINASPEQMVCSVLGGTPLTDCNGGGIAWFKEFVFVQNWVLLAAGGGGGLGVLLLGVAMGYCCGKSRTRKMLSFQSIQQQ